MIVHYKCRCMKEETTILVPDRRPLGDIMKWMDVVQICISEDHVALSPRCKERTMEYAKFPLENDQGVGLPATRQ